MMTSAARNLQPETPAYLAAQQQGSRQLYFAMLEERGGTAGQIDELVHSASRAFLLEQLGVAATLDTDFPTEIRTLPGVMREAHEQTAQAYRHYLEERHAGAPRCYLSCRSHAMYFLRAVAPTKLVDGAWLYGLLQRWQEPRLAKLIQTYLEELGCGHTQQNHVLLYKRLLARYGCDNWQHGPDPHFTQGAVQLALAHHADEFLPELIGFNLGYEQLPLHLPISAYELNELNIDPYYFTLHVTIDNAATGHARKALQSVLECAPKMANAGQFHRRVANGYRLNLVGTGTSEVIAAFDLEQELLRVLADKALTGAKLHSDDCLVGGRSVSDWLSSPDEIASMLTALQAAGWICRGESPEHSRFWRLLTDEQAPMFGVFDGYEQQLLKDWILADAAQTPGARSCNHFRQRQSAGPAEVAVMALPLGATVRQIIAQHADAYRVTAPRAITAYDRGESGPYRCADIEALFRQLAGVNTRQDAFAVLTGMLSPANHPTPAGLAATRLFADLFQQVT